MTKEEWAVRDRQRDELRAKFSVLFSECFDFSPPPGWFSIVEKLSEKLAVDTSIRCVQVKTKLGGLRYYLKVPAPSWVNEAVREAEEEAWRTCERCSALAAPVETQEVWKSTLCSVCRSRV